MRCLKSGTGEKLPYDVFADTVARRCEIMTLRMCEDEQFCTPLLCLPLLRFIDRAANERDRTPALNRPPSFIPDTCPKCFAWWRGMWNSTLETIVVVFCVGPETPELVTWCFGRGRCAVRTSDSNDHYLGHVLEAVDGAEYLLYTLRCATHVWLGFSTRSCPVLSTTAVLPATRLPRVSRI